MNNIDFKVGDVVCLKSGGPSMTVEEIGEYFGTSGTHVKCTWFDGGKRMSEIFHPDTLKLDKD